MKPRPTLVRAWTSLPPSSEGRLSLGYLGRDSGRRSWEQNDKSILSGAGRPFKLCCCSSKSVKTSYVNTATLVRLAQLDGRVLSGATA